MVDREYTVKALIRSLAAEDEDAVVTLGIAPGTLSTVTGTVNGFVILDAARPGNAVKAQSAIAAHALRSAVRSSAPDRAMDYAHDAGLFRSTLEHVRAQLAKLTSIPAWGNPQEVRDGIDWCWNAIEDALSMSTVHPPDDTDAGYVHNDPHVP